MVCHKCKWFKGPPSQEHMEACINCDFTGDSPSNKGRSHVSIDAGGAQTAAEVEAALSASLQEEPLDLDDPDTVTAMKLGALAALNFLARQDPAAASMMLMAFNMSFADMGRKLGMSRQAVWARWQALVLRNPELRGIIQGLH